MYLIVSSFFRYTNDFWPRPAWLRFVEVFREGRGKVILALHVFNLFRPFMNLLLE